MSQRTRAGRRLAALLFLAAVGNAGCTPAILWHMAKGEAKKPAEYPLAAKEGKKEVTVAILATASPMLPVEFAGVERDLAQLVAKNLETESKDAKKPIKVVDRAKVEKYLATHPQWKTQSSARIGKEVGADYVLDLSVESIGMYQQEYGREAFCGSASVKVAVYDSENDAAVHEYSQQTHTDPKPTSSGSPAAYRQHFLQRLATELAWRNVEHSQERTLGPLK